MSGHVEVERKFLVLDPSIVDGRAGEQIDQGYLFAKEGYAVRVRKRVMVETDGSTQRALSELTFKGPKRGATRHEFEQKVEDHEQFIDGLLALAPARILKTRYPIIDGGETWEIDVFHELNQGLIVAELERENAHKVASVPAWCGQEVTYDDRYNNENLAVRPYTTW